MTREEAKKLVKQMTLEEKAGLCSGKDFWRLKSVERLGIPDVTDRTDYGSSQKKRGRISMTV